MKVTQLISEGSENARFRWMTVRGAEGLVDDGRDIIQGLSQKQKTLPSRYLYDDFGSELFEQITDLSEYYPTRTEQSIIEKYASEITQFTGACELVELLPSRQKSIDLDYICCKLQLAQNRLTIGRDEMK